MSQPRSPQEIQVITLQQKRTLIAVYQRTGNMSRAMREANIRSPRTAYLWWHRFCEAGEAGLQPRSRARHTQKRMPNTLVKEICELRRQEPSWGRRQIASVLAQHYGRQVVSPSSVETVLRDANLWEPTAHSVEQTPETASAPDWLRRGIDYDLLLATVREGIRLSAQSNVREAISALYQLIWRPLGTDPTLRRRLLATPELGSWLFSSRLHLGHSLMNGGYWPEAERCLRETVDWMRHLQIEPHQRDWEDAVPFVSLRRDDVWLGCYQHWGLVVGKSDTDRAIGYLQTALGAVRRPHRPVVPHNQAMVGDLERDLAYLRLRLPSLPEYEIRQHLHQAQQIAENAGSLAAQAFTHFAWAKLHDRLAREAGAREQATYRQRRNQMEGAMLRALELMEGEQDDRPLRLTLCYVDAAQLAHAHGMPIDSQWIKRAAEYSLAYGYGGQAQQLLAIPGVGTWLPDEARKSLSRLSQTV